MKKTTEEKIKYATRCVDDAMSALTLVGDHRACKRLIKYAIEYLDTGVKPVTYSVSAHTDALLGFRLTDAQSALRAGSPGDAEFHLRLALNLLERLDA